MTPVAEPIVEREPERPVDIAPTPARRAAPREARESVIAADITITGKIDGTGHVRIATSPSTPAPNSRAVSGPTPSPSAGKSRATSRMPRTSRSFPAACSTATSKRGRSPSRRVRVCAAASNSVGVTSAISCHQRSRSRSVVTHRDHRSENPGRSNAHLPALPGSDSPEHERLSIVPEAPPLRAGQRWGHHRPHLLPPSCRRNHSTSERGGGLGVRSRDIDHERSW
jgi:hypothetical protein